MKSLRERGGVSPGTAAEGVPRMMSFFIPEARAAVIMVASGFIRVPRLKVRMDGLSGGPKAETIALQPWMAVVRASASSSWPSKT